MKISASGFKVEKVRNPLQFSDNFTVCVLYFCLPASLCCDVHGFSSCSFLVLTSVHWPNPKMNGPYGLIYLLCLFSFLSSL